MSSRQVITAFAMSDAAELAEQLRPCSSDRAWMDDSLYRMAYRCVPMVAANTLGWEILNPVACEAVWNGDSTPQGIDVSYYDEKNPESPLSHFGSGILTWDIPFLFRTPPGYGLLVTGPANTARSGIVPLEAFINSDWLPYVFKMNWKFTEMNKTLHFEKGEPVCRIFPYPKDCGDSMEMEIRSLDDDPEFRQRVLEWRDDRENSEKEALQNPYADYKKRWNRNYVRGQDSAGNKQEAHKNVFKCKPVIDKRN